jgi:ACDE family multidrug resistance protein
VELSQGKLYKDRNINIVFGVTLMSVVAVASITPAFPKIVVELHIAEAQVGMLITAFTLPGVILIPFIGVFADRFGRKRLLVPSLFLFGLAGGACALTSEFSILVVLRVFQGIGGAALGALNVTILGDLFSGEHRAAAIGLNTSVLNLAVAAYPLIGGALATLAWNYPFFLPLAAIPVGFLVLFGLNNPEPRNKQSLGKYLGSVWGYLKDIKIAGAFAAGVSAFVVLYGSYMTYLSLFLADSFSASPFIIGLFSSGVALSAALVSSQLGRMVRIMSLTNLLKVSFVFHAASLVLLPFMPRLELVLIPVIIFGIGFGMTTPSLQTYIAGAAPAEYRAAFMSVNGAMLRLGQTLGPLIFGMVYSCAGFRGTFLAGAGLALTVAVVGFVGGKMVR